jgi:hypothetical protein
MGVLRQAYGLHICIDQLGDLHGTYRRRSLEDGEGQ